MAAGQARVTPSLPPVRLCHLYPEEMNIYADRGNIAVLRRRLEWRGLALDVTAAGVGAEVVPGAHDISYLGGGQDRDQAAVADDLVRNKGAAVASAVEDLVDDPGAVISVRLEGSFTSVLVRSVPPQDPPYRPYLEVCATDEVRWEHRPFEGVFVGFRFPDL